METRGVTMLPREHGAYAQIALPLVAALGSSRPTLASASIAIAACAAFVAHEPALILLGHRGTRARRECAQTARRWLIGALAVAVVLATFGVLASPRAAIGMIAPGVSGACAAVFVLRRRERTLGGELVAGAALSSAAIPVALAGALSWPDALSLWAVFFAAFAGSTVEVRRITHQAPNGLPRAAVWMGIASLVAVVATVHPFVALASIPVFAVLALIAAAPPSPRTLRRLGWTLAVAMTVTALTVVGAFAIETRGHSASARDDGGALALQGHGSTW